MKTWRRFLAAVVMIAMLTPMTAIGEDADTIIEALVIPDSQAEAVSETGETGETGATDVIAITDLDDSASATNADTDPRTLCKQRKYSRKTSRPTHKRSWIWN